MCRFIGVGRKQNTIEYRVSVCLSVASLADIHSVSLTFPQISKGVDLVMALTAPLSPMSMLSLAMKGDVKVRLQARSQRSGKLTWYST